ncbi:Fasciclin-like arabinogalactan protein 14 [Acorus gramineus]|uniref:Fasciclin-like arabinogalactan protein 14 n=1 Tax=Acorus gramineus TaxID=55184 RepID=A0AAV9AVQ0_ACOGR|nr:Fasciclin-like arabinogalactan protein 14 [Acorus gramineus]
MDSKSSLHHLLLLLLLLSAATFSAAFNITKILNQYPDYSVFNALLSETGIADAINHRQTITVLAVPNGPASSLSSQPPDVAKRLASLHVVLDYYDLDKLRSLSKGTTLTTLFQTTGLASSHLGFLNVSHTKNPDGLAFGSAVPGSPLSASLVKTVAAQPYNVSVLEVSAVIFPPGIAAAPAPMKQDSLARADAPVAHAPKASAGGDEDAPAPAVVAPKASAEAPKAAGKSSPPSPMVASAPAHGDSLFPSAEAPGPVAANDYSSGSRVGFGLAGLAGGVGVAILAAL